ncbi:MAG: hypothetical protein OEQ47_06330 [Acidimicrobiia bacterium]|nr:hypothetical protein [Acidimicrobiia bacterium]
MATVAERLAEGDVGGVESDVPWRDVSWMPVDPEIVEVTDGTVIP